LCCAAAAALLSLTSGNGDNVDRDMLSAVGFAALCLEKFSGVKRYRKKLWHDLALNGGIQPLKSLLRSSLLTGRLERVRTAVAAVFRNLDIDTSDVGVAIDPSSYETVPRSSILLIFFLFGPSNRTTGLRARAPGLEPHLRSQGLLRGLRHCIPTGRHRCALRTRHTHDTHDTHDTHYTRHSANTPAARHKRHNTVPIAC
jgi:hypothetical protein